MLARQTLRIARSEKLVSSSSRRNKALVGGAATGAAEAKEETSSISPSPSPPPSRPLPSPSTDVLSHRAQEAEARSSILAQILEPEAADRLGRIRLVKESRAQDVENRLIMLARSGQLRNKVTEEQLKELLGAVAETKEEEKIVVSRRKGGWDDDDDDLFDL